MPNIQKQITMAKIAFTFIYHRIEKVDGSPDGKQYTSPGGTKDVN